MRVGLNNFLRFISVTGISKVNQVMEALQDYRDWKDFYKDFREAAILAIASKNTRRLEALVSNLSDERKARHYAICLEGLKQWISKTNYRFVSRPRSASWTSGEIRISVNPEMILEIDGETYVVKLYMAKEQLSQLARKAYAWLIGETHKNGSTPAILEVRKGKLIPCQAPNRRIGQWIKGEVAAFVALWKMNSAA